MCIRDRRFIHVNGLFWLIRLFRDPAPGKTNSVILNFSQQIPPEKLEAQLQQAVRFCLTGYYQEPGSMEDFPALENASWLGSRDMLEKDRIFSAIEEVIDEVGYAEASLEKIAERIGITKSSLYFYFKNRNDLLLKTLVREQEHFFTLASARLAEYPGLREKLYSLFIVALSYLANKPKFMTVLHWARYRKLGITLPHEKLMSIYRRFTLWDSQKTVAGKNAQSTDPEVQFMFMLFFLVNEIHYLPLGENMDSNNLPLIRDLFRLYCVGVTGISPIPPGRDQ